MPIAELRASIVIGAGSLPFEMVRALADRLPVMICPRWVAVKTQPIAAADVVRYLVAAIDLPEGAGGVYEIGGPDVVSYADIIDCWRVEALEPDRRLRLIATMKMPGRAWLTFEVSARTDGSSRLTQRAEFEPRGALGRLYWYVLLPVHTVMFGGMIRAIARRGRDAPPPAASRRA